MPPTLLDAYLPICDVSARYEIHIPAPPEVVHRALRHADLSQSLVVKALFLVRGLGVARGPLTLDRMRREGFMLLGDDAERELVFGVAGRFWKLSGGREPIRPEEFREFARPGSAKAALNFLVGDASGGSRLSTETRVQCFGARCCGRCGTRR